MLPRTNPAYSLRASIPQAPTDDSVALPFSLTCSQKNTSGPGVVQGRLDSATDAVRQWEWVGQWAHAVGPWVRARAALVPWVCADLRVPLVRAVRWARVAQDPWAAVLRAHQRRLGVTTCARAVEVGDRPRGHRRACSADRAVCRRADPARRIRVARRLASCRPRVVYRTGAMPCRPRACRHRAVAGWACQVRGWACRLRAWAGCRLRMGGRR